MAVDCFGTRYVLSPAANDVQKAWYTGGWQDARGSPEVALALTQPLFQLSRLLMQILSLLSFRKCLQLT